MSFPFEIDESVEMQVNEPCEYGIDFETGKLTGIKVYGLEAIKVWIWNALKTSRYRHVIHSWDFGNELEDLIGKGYSEEYINTEVPRMISECLLINENILGVKDFNFSLRGDKLHGSFVVNTTYGEAIQNV